MTDVPFVKLDREYAEIREEVNVAIRDVLESGWYVLGEHVESFESSFAEYVAAEHGVGVNSGSDALYLALRALGVGAGDEVVTVSHTFVATADAIVRNGARPVFVDVDPETYTMDAAAVEDVITEDTAAILPVHLYGQPADLDPLLDLADAHDLAVVEDAAQAHGATYRGSPVGSLGDVGCFSFYPVKNLGAYGDGGMIVTDDETVATEVERLRELGSRRKYHHESVGVNSRLDELQAAILAVKLDHLAEWNDQRRTLASRYDALLDLVETPVERERTEHVYHLYVIRTENREGLQEYLADHGVDTLVHYPIPVHRQDAYAEYRGLRLPVTVSVSDEILSLPISPWHTREDIERVASLVETYHE